MKPNIRLRDDIIWHILTQWAQRHEYGLSNARPAVPHRVWIGGTYTYATEIGETTGDDGRRIRVSAANRRAKANHQNGISMEHTEIVALPINVGNYHWITVIIYVQEGRVDIIDSLGGDHPRVVRHLRRWLQLLQQTQHRPVTRWTFRYCDTGRQENGVDCGLFTISDIMAAVEVGTGCLI